MKTPRASLTSKGQITIPAYVRNKLRLTSGDMLQFFLTNDSFVVVPINRSVKDLRGILPKPTKSLTIEEMDEIIKGSYDRN